MSSGSKSYLQRPLIVTTSSNPDDESLQEEFHQLVTTVDARLKCFLLTLTSNPHDADDVLQDAYEIAWRRFAEFDRDTNFYQWVARIAFNQARNFNRKRRKHRGMGLSDEVLSDLAKMSSGNSELLEMRQQQLRHCISLLRPLDQTLLMDYYREEHPKADLARRYGIRSDLLYKRLFRLRKKLYDCINNNLGLKNRHT